MENFDRFKEKRHEYNLKIQKEVSKLINKYPELRYGQIMVILGIDNLDFNEEPWVTYEKMRVRNITE